MHFSKGYRHWWGEEVILTVGAKTYTRQDCVRQLGCPNFQAARNLSKALASLNVTTPRQLAKTKPHDLMQLAGVGERTIFVALCVLDKEAGDRAAQDWLHSDDKKKHAAA